MLSKLNLTQNNNIILVRDFKFLFNVKIENYRGNAALKKRSVGKIFELKEIYNLTEIFRIRNPKANQYTFRQNYVGVLSKTPRLFFHLL